MVKYVDVEDGVTPCLCKPPPSKEVECHHSKSTADKEPHFHLNHHRQNVNVRAKSNGSITESPVDALRSATETESIMIFIIIFESLSPADMLKTFICFQKAQKPPTP